MAKVRRINVSKVEGNDANDNITNEIRPYGEIGLYEGDYISSIDNDRLELLIFDGQRTHLKSKVLSPGIFYGSGADSGDGAGLDTIKLVPDAEIFRNGSNQYIVVDPTVPNHIHLRAGGTIDQSNADLFLGGEKNHVRVSDSIRSVTISTDDSIGAGGTRQWTFDTNGVLTLPVGDGIVGQDGIRLWGQGAFSSTSFIGLPNNVDATVTHLTIGNYSSAGVLIQAGTSNPPKNWFFNGNGNLTVPGSITSGTTSATGTQVTGVRTWDGAGVNLYVWLNAASDPLLVQLNGLGSLNGWTVSVDGGNSATIIATNPQGFFTIETDQPLTGTGTLTFTSPDYAPSSVNNLPLVAGPYTWTFGTNGTLTFPNNALVDSADSNIEFRGMNNFNVEAGGVVNVVTAASGVAHSWQFGDDGILTFPDATTQTTAYVSDTGSWTVTSGTANYSFTVPLNGTYTMWVRGNIPNGIIAWNATATVTNGNVPVLGQQFAWNYTDAGSPLLITAIPDQFTGTAGTINTANTYVGTTSNTFTFGISNTSGGDVNVEWGYSKV